MILIKRSHQLCPLISRAALYLSMMSLLPLSFFSFLNLALQGSSYARLNNEDFQLTLLRLLALRRPPATYYRGSPMVNIIVMQAGSSSRHDDTGVTVYS